MNKYQSNLVKVNYLMLKLSSNLNTIFSEEMVPFQFRIPCRACNYSNSKISSDGDCRISRLCGGHNDTFIDSHYITEGK